jgi:hypothetical protein
VSNLNITCCLFSSYQDDHNPHLELTLSSRKKISSVLEHLNRKWGNSNIASGELILFPYCANQEDLATYQRWTTRDTVAVADVFLSVNSPSVFRLRYIISLIDRKSQPNGSVVDA